MKDNSNVWYAIGIIMLWVLFAIFIASLFSCSPQKRWSDKGFRKGWIDTSTIKLIDTVHFAGSSKDTSWLFSKDTVFLKDENFTTYYFRDTITHKQYLKTIVNNHDTVIVREIHHTSIQVSKFSFVDHIKALWPIWLGLIAVIFIIGAVIFYLKVF